MPRATRKLNDMLPLSRDDAPVVRLDKPRRQSIRRPLDDLTVVVLDAWLRRAPPVAGWRADRLVAEPLRFGVPVPWAAGRRLEVLSSALQIPGCPDAPVPVVARGRATPTTFGSSADGTLRLHRAPDALRLEVWFRDGGAALDALDDWTARRLFLFAIGLRVTRAMHVRGDLTVIEAARVQVVWLSGVPLRASEPLAAATTPGPPTTSLGLWG